MAESGHSGQPGTFTRNVYGTNLISRDASGAKAFYLYNGHHDVVQLMTSTGSVVASYYYDAFGVILEESGSGSNPVTVKQPGTYSSTR